MANPAMTRFETEFEKMAAPGQYQPAGYQQPPMSGYPPAGYPQAPMPGYAQTQFPATAGAPTAGYPGGYPPINPQQAFGLEQSYQAPAADAVTMGRMTLDDVIVKTAILFGIFLVAATGAWFLTSANVGLGVILTGIGFLAGFILAMINVFKKAVSPALVMAYAFAEGIALGALSATVELAYPGLVLEAVVGTVMVFGITLGLYKFGIVRYSSGMAKFTLFSLLGIIGFSLVSLILSWTGVVANLNSVTVWGIPLGVIVGVFAVLIGAFCLIGDFDIAARGAQRGLPVVFAWRCAFGLMVTIVWIYLEILRILIALAGRR